MRYKEPNPSKTILLIYTTKSFKRKSASSPSYSCCGNDLTIKSTAVRLSIINKFNFEYVTFAIEAFENVVNFRIKAIKEEAFQEIIVPLKDSVRLILVSF